jgi:hypothetical protein
MNKNQGENVNISKLVFAASIVFALFMFGLILLMQLMSDIITVDSFTGPIVYFIFCIVGTIFFTLPIYVIERRC